MPSLAIKIVLVYYTVKQEYDCSAVCSLHQIEFIAHRLGDFFCNREHGMTVAFDDFIVCFIVFLTIVLCWF
jgi:hypothetical protein